MSATFTNKCVERMYVLPLPDSETSFYQGFVGLRSLEARFGNLNDLWHFISDCRLLTQRQKLFPAATEFFNRYAFDLSGGGATGGLTRLNSKNFTTNYWNKLQNANLHVFVTPTSFNRAASFDAPHTTNWEITKPAIIPAGNPQGHTARILFSLGQHLHSGTELLPGENLASPYNACHLRIEENGDLNVVHRIDQSVIWSAGTKSKTPGRLILHADGGLRLYDKEDKEIWSSKTSSAGYFGSTLILTDQGVLRTLDCHGKQTWTSAA